MERTEQLTRAAAPAVEADRSYVDWPAILGGAVVATAVGGLFAAFGAALGLSAISAEPGEGSVNLSVFLSALWMVVTLVASYALGGYIAGRMRRRTEQATADEVTVRDGINGLVVWGVAMIVGALLVANVVAGTVRAAGAVAGTVAETAGNIAGGAVEGVAGAAGAALPEAAGAEATGFLTDTLLRPAAADPVAATPAEVARQAGSIMANLARTGEIADTERAYLVSAVVATTGAAEPDAAARVDEAVAAAQAARDEAARLAEEARQTAVDAAETARISAVLTGFLIAAASLVAAAAAYVGAVRGGRHRDEGIVFGGLAYRR